MKRTFALVLALVVALSAMTVCAFALSYDFEDGLVGDWNTHGGQGNLSVVDGKLLTSGRWNGAFKTSHDLGALTAGTTYTVTVDFYADPSDMDIDGAINYSILIIDYSSSGVMDGAAMDLPEFAKHDVTIATGTAETVTFTFTPDADIANALIAINTINHDPWAKSPEFYIDNVSVVEGGAPAVEDTPVDEPADAPVEDEPVDAPVEDEPVDAPVEDTPAEETPAETGLALAVVPGVIALAAVALSKKR